MFAKIEVARYKCLRQVDIALSPLNVLIGPNASGKSTFLDCLAFIRDALESDVEKAVRKRAYSLRELVWKNERVDRGFEIAIEADLPAHLTSNGCDRVRYEVGVGLDESGAIRVSGERFWLVNVSRARRGRITQPVHGLSTQSPQSLSKSEEIGAPSHAYGAKSPPGYRVVVRKAPDNGSDYFHSEKTGLNFTLRLSPRRLALASVPEDQDRFPITLWFKQMLLQNIQMLQLNSVFMRRACPSNAPHIFQSDGSNLPVMVQQLQKHSERFAWWIQHLRTILQDLEDVSVAERPEDRSRYLVVNYRNGLAVPSWLLSDSTLRLLALTLIAYLPNQNQVFIIEEPENGIHPNAIDAIIQSLGSVYDGQVFLTTHSPQMLEMAKPEHLLVFAKTDSGAAAVVNGTNHPILRIRTQEMPQMPRDALFSAGVL